MELKLSLQATARAYSTNLLPFIRTHLKTLNDELPIEFKRHKNVAFTGDVSVGKSSLLNKLFDLHLDVGADHTTTGIQFVFRSNNVAFWDTPGKNTDDQLLLYPKAAKFLLEMDLIVIMYNSDLSTVAGLIQLARALRRPVALVRMKVDQILQAEKRGEKPLSHFVAKDRQRFPEWPVFACSAWDPAGTDNDRFKAFLLYTAKSGPASAAASR